MSGVEIMLLLLVAVCAGGVGYELMAAYRHRRDMRDMDEVIRALDDAVKMAREVNALADDLRKQVTK